MSAYSCENGIRISLRVLEIYISFREVNFWKTEDLIIAVYRHVSSEVSQHPRHIEAKFQRLPHIFGVWELNGTNGILSDVTRSLNLKMTAAKPEVLTSQLLDKIATKFQRLSRYFWGPETALISSL